MMKSIGWDKIRVLVTNRCNYRCPFCHNEGQKKVAHLDMMPFDSFSQLVDIVRDLDISELNISGGEPFMNPQIVDMIIYVNDKLTCDISCATNLSLIKKEDLDRLAHTRVKFNIQFPFVEKDYFQHSTGNGNIEIIQKHIDMVCDAGLAVGLNCVIQNEDELSFDAMLQFAISKELPLKLLPQIGGYQSYKYKEFAIPLIDQYAIDFKDKEGGALRWIVENNGHRTSVLYIDSPCFHKDFAKCRNFGEVRIHPNFMAQSCILKDTTTQLFLENGKDYVQSQLSQLWKDFTTC